MQFVIVLDGIIPNLNKDDKHYGKLLSSLKKVDADLVVERKGKLQLANVYGGLMPYVRKLKKNF